MNNFKTNICILIIAFVMLTNSMAMPVTNFDIQATSMTDESEKLLEIKCNVVFSPKYQNLCNFFSRVKHRTQIAVNLPLKPNYFM